MTKPPREDRPKKDRPKLRAKAEAAEAEGAKSAAEAFRRRRNRRFLFLGVIALTFPILEAIAYQFRVIEITFVNGYRSPITNLKVTYPGGEFTEGEIKPADSITRKIRPDFSFKQSEFSTYRLMIQFRYGDGLIYRQMSRAGTIDYSAHETFTVAPNAMAGQVDVPAQARGLQIELHHTTRPGFPLGTVREFFKRLGLG